ncbi:MAG: hypothetical protein MUO26_01715 [Methanotrichaceae archaeon]|nr:hypothetical protein [Methanotrichaceae archaeon]
MQTCSKEVSTIGKITDRRAFLEGVFFAQRAIGRIRNEGALLSLRALRDPKGILSGLEGVSVAVEGVNLEAEKYGLTQQLLQTDTELRLRTHGIKVAADVLPQDEKLVEQTSADGLLRLWQHEIDAKSGEDFLQSTNEWVRRDIFETYQLSGLLPILHVNVNTIVFEESRRVAFSIEVELQDAAYLCRNSATYAAPIWEKSSVGTCSSSRLKDYVRECLRDKVDEFINDYLAANPKEHSSEEKQ